MHWCFDRSCGFLEYCSSRKCCTSFSSKSYDWTTWSCFWYDRLIVFKKKSSYHWSLWSCSSCKSSFHGSLTDLISLIYLWNDSSKAKRINIHLSESRQQKYWWRRNNLKSNESNTRFSFHNFLNKQYWWFNNFHTWISCCKWQHKAIKRYKQNSWKKYRVTLLFRITWFWWSFFRHYKRLD